MAYYKTISFSTTITIVNIDFFPLYLPLPLFIYYLYLVDTLDINGHTWNKPWQLSCTHETEMHVLNV